MVARSNLKTLHYDDLEDKICVVVGTRPGIVMFSPIIRELERQKTNFFVIHTGQHYSYNMDRQLFEDLNLREPDYKLENVQNFRLHGEQTAEMLKGCERILIEEQPKVTLVGGDANTNLAATLAALKLHIKVGHIESGERSGDWRMPEEYNRVIIDRVSEFLFTTNEKGKQNLIKDNVRGEIFVSGNPIVDAAMQNRHIAEEKSSIVEDFGLEPGGYFALTLHREENVDTKDVLANVLEGIRLISDQFGKKVVFLIHPRTRNRIKEFGLGETANDIKGLTIKEAVGYLDFLKLLGNASLVLTDSGGVQQESCILQVPCVTLRENTEWTETLEIGANTLSGTIPDQMVAGVEKMINVERNWQAPFGDGDSAVKIINAIKDRIGMS